MSRPRVYQTPRSATAIRLPTDLLARLHTEADARDVSVNWLINRAVEWFVNDLLPVDQVVPTRSQLSNTERDSAPSEDSDRDAANSVHSGRHSGVGDER